MSLLKNNLFRNLSQLILVTFLIMTPVLFVVAVDTIDVNPSSPDSQGKIVNPIKVDSINGFIKILLKGVLEVGIPIVALAVIYCGFLFVSARGNSEKLTKAKDALLYTLIGAAILLGSWAIAQMISETVLAL